MKQLKILSIVFGFVLVTSFVVVKKDKEQLVQERLVERMNDYKMEQLEKCYKKAMEEAETTVDSIIAIELGAGPIDTLDFPRKPMKPAFESYDSLKQNDIPIKPLFEKSGIREQN